MSRVGALVCFEGGETTFPTPPFESGGEGIWLHGFPSHFVLDGMDVWVAGWLGKRRDFGESREDAEIVTRAWQRWGSDCLLHLEGEFLVMTWQRRERRLWLAQSRTAGFLVHYHWTPKFFAFSTRIRDLFQLPGVTAQLDAEWFCRQAAGYPWIRHSPRRTCFHGIELLPPANRLTATDWEVLPEDYWSPRVLQLERSPEEVWTEVRHRLQESVEDACAGQQHVACLFSGGLDSTAVAALASRHTRVTAISSVLSPQYASSGRDERPWIEGAARHLGIPVRYVHPPAQPGPWVFPDEQFERRPAPFCSPRHDLYESLLQAAASEGCSVLLDGQGGEMGPTAQQENLFLHWLLRGHWARLAEQLALEVRRTGRPTQSLRRLVQPLRRLVLGLLPIPFPSPLTFLRAQIPLESAARGRRLDLRSLCRPRLPLGVRMVDKKMLRAAASDGYGVGLRRPLLSPSLIEYCAGLGMEHTFHNGLDRAIVRGALRDDLPPEIRSRTDKMPFSPDFVRRCRDNLESALVLWTDLSRLESVRALLDVDKVKQALRHSLKVPALMRGSLLYRTQATFAAAQFLRWQSEL